MLRRAVLAMVFAVGAVPLSAQPCLACSCAGRSEGQSRQEYRESKARSADVVFTGKVRRIDGQYFSNDTVKVRFWVCRKYKGRRREKLTITPSSGTTCAYHFEDGKCYTVFGYGKGPDTYRTSLCTGTQRGRIDGEDYGFN